jgi:methylmalonyl-CoA/ethylmalonyl-CoA epimerase
MHLGRLHHVGVLVQDITQAAEHYVRRLGFEVIGPIIHDPAQTAYVRFLRQPGDSVYLELVSPDRPDSKLSNALAKGGGLNHVCYAVDDIESACRELRSPGIYLLQAPVSAVAFPGRKVAWLIGRDRIPIELLERGPDGQP